jgi:hypothetical protein
MNVKLEAWLNSRDKDYEEGLSLFRQLGDGGFLLTVLEIGETDYNRHKLLEALIDLSKVGEAPAPDQLTVKEIGIATDAEYNRFPDEVRKLVADLKDLYKINAHRHGELSAYIKQSLKLVDLQERTKFLKQNKTGDLANMILDTSDEIEELKLKIDHFKLTGQRLPKRESLPEEMSLFDLTRMQRNLRSRISKSKKNPDKMNQLIQQLADVERRMNALI